MGARKISNVISISEYMYMKYIPLNLKKDTVTATKKRDIRKNMVSGYIQMLSNQIKQGGE